MTETHTAQRWRIAFGTPLTWIALVGRGDVVENLSLGRTEEESVNGLVAALASDAKPRKSLPPVAKRLTAFVQGCPDDFLDVPIDPGVLTPFRQRVVDHCRRIPLGKTLTYAQLALEAGSPGAARAVGNCMATNRIPLIIPCHRVVGAEGRLCGYSGCGGVAFKKQLLEMEAWLKEGKK
jgi:methylated-DNA-[protein]-cysteine S-methyltransferase